MFWQNCQKLGKADTLRRVSLPTNERNVVKARSVDQKRLWCKQIKKIILDNYNAVIPDKAKELVMMLGNKVEGKHVCRLLGRI